MFTAIKPSLLVLFFPFLPKTLSHSPICRDVSAFSFGEYEYKGRTYTKTCKWLTITPIKAETRKSKWCDAEWNGVNVGIKCAETCDKCSHDISTLPNTSVRVGIPNIPPSTSCKDDSDFSFGQYQSQGVTYTKNCEWMVKDPVKREIRTTKWCDAEWNGVNVGTKCIKACRTCTVEGEILCRDVSAFSFGEYEYEGRTYTKTCKWLTITPIKAETRKSKWCDAEWNGINVGIKCAETCDKCQNRKNRNIRRRF
jgi:hypothetical protein